MKVLWLAIVGLSLSASAYAECPAGTQGSNSWEESVATAKRVLGQDVLHGSRADEKDTDGRPVRIQFLNNDGKVAINVFRSTGKKDKAGNPKKFDINQIMNVSTDVCSGDGSLTLINPKVTIKISGEGSQLDVVASSSMGSMNMVFGPVVGGTDVATTGGAGR